jgi:hypothetical protein
MDGSQDIWNRSACHCREAFWEGRGRHGGLGRLTGIAGVVEDPNHREFLLIELKRPSLTVGRKELDQLEDYVTTILTQPDFINTATTWNFYLVTSEYDDVVKQRITQDNRPLD